MNCGEMQKSEGQQQAEMIAMQQQQQQQQQQQAQSVVTTSGCVVNQAPQMHQPFQTLQLQQPPPSSTPLPSPSPVAMQMMPPQQSHQMQQFATEWQGQRIQLVPQQQGPMYVQQVYNAQNGQQFLIPANNVIHHPGQPLQVITTGKPTFQSGPMTPQLITQQGKATMVQAAQQQGTTQCYIPAQQANANQNQQTLLISHVGGQQGTAVMPQPSPSPKQGDSQKQAFVQGKVLQAQPKNMQQQQNMIVQQQPQQIITQAALPNQQIINPMQWQSFPNQGTVWAQPAGGMPMNANAINTTSSPIFIRSTQPDGTHVYIQSNQIQQQMQQTQVAAPTPMMQQQPQQHQLKPAITKAESQVPPNIQPKVAPAGPKTLTIRPSGNLQPALIQPASTVSTQTSVAVSTSKCVTKVKLKAARPAPKPLTPELNKQPLLQQQQQVVQQQVSTTSAPQQIIVNKVLLPNNQPVQMLSGDGGGGAKMTSAPTQPLLTKLVPVSQSQPMQFLPQSMPLAQTVQAPAPPTKEKASVGPLQPLAPPVLDMPKAVASPDATPTSDDNKDVDERSSSPDAADDEEEIATSDERIGEKLQALVKPQVLTHVIEGFVIQEAGEPFPTTTTEERATCEFCRKTDLRSKFKRSKRFCSSSCAKSHKRQKDEKVGGKKPRPAPSESSGEELVIDETTNSSANPESTPSPTGNPNVNPQEWTVKEVCDFIQVLPGCAEYVEDFSVQEIDGQALMLLRADHLMSAMGMKLGPALKICDKIKQLKSGIVDTT